MDDGQTEQAPPDRGEPQFEQLQFGLHDPREPKPLRAVTPSSSSRADKEIADLEERLAAHRRELSRRAHGGRRRGQRSRRNGRRPPARQDRVWAPTWAAQDHLERQLALERVDPNNDMNVTRMNETAVGRYLVASFERIPMQDAREVLKGDFVVDLHLMSWALATRARARPRSRRRRAASSRSSARSGDSPEGPGSSQPPGVAGRPSIIVGAS